MSEKLINLFLKARGYTLNYLAQINQNGNRELNNINQLCYLLKQIHDSQQKIIIMPDFDCDGVMSGTLGYSGMSQLGFNVQIYMPHPEQGYGITTKDIDRVLASSPDTKWLISCDVGQTCYEAFAYAYQKGLKVLVTDHHEQVPNKTKLKSETVVNPCQFNETYNSNRPDDQFNICGAFVFYQVLCRYAELYDHDQINLINSLSVFAGIGTIGDMMPLIQENRLLIKDTISILNFLQDTVNLETILTNVSPIYFKAFNGLKIWLDVLQAEHKIFGEIDEKFLGWTLVPMINSVKRLNLPMNLIFGIFFGLTPLLQYENAKQVIVANDQRKIMVKSYLGRIEQETIDHKQPYAPFIFFTDALGSVLGLIANQIMRITDLPTFVINKQNLSGSGRSLAYFPVFSATKNTEFNVRGHELAFGINFTDMQQIERFYNFIKIKVPPLVKNYQKTSNTQYDLQLGIQGHQNLPILTTVNGIEFINDTKQLKPFGQGFKEPEVAIQVTKEQAQFKTMGKQQQHLKIILPDQIELIAWNKANQMTELTKKEIFTFHGNLGINEFNGNTKLQVVGGLD